MPTNHSLFTENNRNQTEPIEDVKPAENGYSKTHAMERFIKKGESKKKINNFTGSLKHSAVNYKRSLTKNATNECLSAEDIRKNSYASMEKKYNKGKLSIKVI